MAQVPRKRRRAQTRKGSAKAAGEAAAPLIGSIDLATLMEFERKTPGTKVCTCMNFDHELAESGHVWMGGEHLVSVVPGTGGVVHTHYYPHRERHAIIMLKIENVEPPSGVRSTDGL